MKPGRQRSVEVRVPASTANLGSGFDCFGLALELYLTVRATVQSEPGSHPHVRSRGEPGSSLLPRAPEENLVFRAMSDAADRESLRLPCVRLAVHNAIPLASGLGSSAAAIVAGVALAVAFGDRPVSEEAALRYAAEREGHADNVAAALLGGLVVTCIREDGSVAAIRKRWPNDIRVVAVTPNFTLETAKARAALPKTVERADAVHNLQRSALLIAALEERRYDLIWDALQDRLHQPHRQSLIPGLADILRMPRTDGLLGLALSGAGPSVVALATDHFDKIGKAIASHFGRNGLTATVRCLAAAEKGAVVTQKTSTARTSR
jgi:homoserine kinase